MWQSQHSVFISIGSLLLGSLPIELCGIGHLSLEVALVEVWHSKKAGEKFAPVVLLGAYFSPISHLPFLNAILLPMPLPVKTTNSVEVLLRNTKALMC